MTPTCASPKRPASFCGALGHAPAMGCAAPSSLTAAGPRKLCQACLRRQSETMARQITRSHAPCPLPGAVLQPPPLSPSSLRTYADGLIGGRQTGSAWTAWPAGSQRFRAKQGAYGVSSSGISWRTSVSTPGRTSIQVRQVHVPRCVRPFSRPIERRGLVIGEVQPTSVPVEVDSPGRRRHDDSRTQRPPLPHRAARTTTRPTALDDVRVVRLQLNAQWPRQHQRRGRVGAGLDDERRARWPLGINGFDGALGNHRLDGDLRTCRQWRRPRVRLGRLGAVPSNRRGRNGVPCFIEQANVRERGWPSGWPPELSPDDHRAISRQAGAHQWQALGQGRVGRGGLATRRSDPWCKCCDSSREDDSETRQLDHDLTVPGAYVLHLEARATRPCVNGNALFTPSSDGVFEKSIDRPHSSSVPRRRGPGARGCKSMMKCSFTMTSRTRFPAGWGCVCQSCL